MAQTKNKQFDMLFSEEDYTRFDYWAIVTGRGIATVHTADFEKCQEWLHAHGYEMTRFDFRSGIAPVVAGLGEFLRWKDQFGYSLSPDSRNLNALRDGFSEYPVPVDGGAVTVLAGFEHAWHEDQDWAAGLLSIGSELSLVQLSLGRRYFVVIEANERESSLLGQKYDDQLIPNPFPPWR